MPASAPTYQGVVRRLPFAADSGQQGGKVTFPGQREYLPGIADDDAVKNAIPPPPLPAPPPSPLRARARARSCPGGPLPAPLSFPVFPTPKRPMPANTFVIPLSFPSTMPMASGSG